MLFIDKATITRAAFRTLRRAAWTFFFERLRPPWRPISRKYALISSLMAGGCGIGASSLITQNSKRAESRLSTPRRELLTRPAARGSSVEAEEAVARYEITFFRRSTRLKLEECGLGVPGGVLRGVALSELVSTELPHKKFWKKTNLKKQSEKIF